MSNCLLSLEMEVSEFIWCTALDLVNLICQINIDAFVDENLECVLEAILTRKHNKCYAVLMIDVF